MTEGQCVVCGVPTSGLRCRVHNGEYQRMQAAEDMAQADRELLAMKDEGLSADRIATRLGISRNRAYQKLRDARKREAIRQG